MSIVLVGVDGSAQSADAVAVAGRLAAAREDELVLVYVHPYGALRSLLKDDEYHQLVRDVVEKAQGDAALHAPTVSVRMEILGDRSPAGGLHRLAARDDARMIVVGSSHRGSVGRVVSGGVAQRLLSGAPCPVVVPPRGWAESSPRQLGVMGCGFDASNDSWAALQAACVLGAALRSTVRVIAVHQRIAFGSIPASMSTSWISVNDQLRDELRRDLHDAIATAPADVRAEACFVEGDPAAALSDASEALDLLVVGSRGYGPLGSVLLGSVGSSLIVRAACPVMVVPRHGTEASTST